MEANELKIGNWVKHNDLTSGSEYPNTEFQIELDHFHDLATSSLLIGSLDPIPLDESWLIRCKQFTRWDYFGDENYGGYFNLWGPWKLMVRHFKSGFVVSIVTIDRKRMCYRLVKEIDLKVSYVHQLQNFIWSARQEELQFAEE